MRRIGVAATVVGFSLCAGEASADICRFDGVRVLIADAGDTSMVEISARVRGDGCTVDFSRVALSSPDGATPSIAVEQTFLGHRLTRVQVADGVNAVNVREWSGEAGVVAVRWIVEGTRGGLRVEVPRSMFPKAADPGARVERRVKSARGGVGKFGKLGDVQVPPSGPGAAGGIGPTGPADEDRAIAEFIPGTGPIVEPIATSIITLDAFRDTLPMRVLDLTPENADGWTEVAKRAYAASLHGDPVVASLGVHTLAWLGSGLSIQAVKIGKTASLDTAAVPASVVDAIGDVDARMTKRYGANGRLLPLGRAGIFRKALLAKPWDDAPRAAAAKAAIARLATVQPLDLTAFLVPAIVDGTAAPIDPPQSVAVAPIQVPQVEPSTPATVEAGRRRAHQKRHPGVFLGIFAAVLAIVWTLRESRD